MIKAEKCKDGIKVEFSCSPLIRTLEFGSIVREFYDVTCKEVGEKRAKKHMSNIFHASMMNEQELEEDIIQKFMEEPDRMLRAVKLQKEIFGGDQDGK